MVVRNLSLKSVPLMLTFETTLQHKPPHCSALGHSSTLSLAISPLMWRAKVDCPSCSVDWKDSPGVSMLVRWPQAGSLALSAQASQVVGLPHLSVCAIDQHPEVGEWLRGLTNNRPTA